MELRQTDLHIGQIIKSEMDNQGRKQQWLAKQIHCDRSNITKLYKHKSLDCEQLLLISKALGINLFEYYTTRL